MEKSTVIRPALREEIYPVASFHNSCWKSEYRGIVSDGFLDSLSDEEKYQKLIKAFDGKTSDFLVMIKDCKMIGVSIFGKSYAGCCPDCGEITAVYVQKDYI